MRTDSVQMRVFIEGVLVPKISSATVMTFANEEARATIVMPSIPGFETEELKRASIHIFWSDAEVRREYADYDWPILFEGEISGDDFSKTVDSRQQAFNCIGYHAYWEQVLLYFYDLSSGAYNRPVWSTDRLSLALGNESFSFDAQVAGANLKQRLVQEVQKDKNEPYHSVVKRIFSDCLDTNYFFRKRDGELKLSNRFASPKDPNLDVLVARTLLTEVIDRDIQSVSGETSMMSILKETLGVFRYQIIQNCQPVLIGDVTQKRRTNSEKEADIDAVYTKIGDHLTSLGLNDPLLYQQIVDQIDGTADETVYEDLAGKVVKALSIEENANKYTELVNLFRNSNIQVANINDPRVDNQSEGLMKGSNDLLTQFLLLPDTRFALPPTCNVIFPGDQTSFSLSRQLLQEPTRAIGLPTVVSGINFNVYLAPPGLKNAVVPEQQVVAVSSSGFYPPVTAPHRISSHYGWRQIKQSVDVYNQRTGAVSKQVLHPDGKKFHHGVDIARPKGTSKAAFIGTPVYAIDDGVVTMASYQGRSNENHKATYDKEKHGYEKVGYGLRIYINHGNGSKSIYAHLDSVDVSVGDRVVRGQKIAGIGNTGRSTGPHLHFEYHVNGKPQDPEKSVLKTGSAEDPAPTTETPEPATTDEEKITEVDKSGDNKFLDYRYLSPEEQKTGIVPYFDQNVLKGYTFTVHNGDSDQVQNHYISMLNSEFLWRRYQTRSMGTLNLPFNPYPVPGFPALVLDRVRSIIGLVNSVTHNISVAGGQGSATTSIQIEAPRFWDEGDPYHWVGGEEKSDTNKDGRTLPHVDYGIFPAYYLTGLIGTNSSATDEWWSEQAKPLKQNLRPVDRLYAALFGPSVRGIPYQYASRDTTMNATVAYNKAIDSRPTKGSDGKIRNNPNTNTILGTYYRLLKESTELAARYVKLMTRRLGASETTIMSTVLGAQTTDGGASYTGGPFRSDYQDLVTKMNLIMATNRAFRG